MIISKLINKEKHIINIISYKELEKQLNKQISHLDILIIDKSLTNIRLIKKFSKKFQNRTLVVQGNEKIKNLKNFQKNIEKIIKIGIQRKSKIYSFGGGTVGDFSGFLASSLLRGIDHIMIPTSLLAMVDSSIGGKTGVNSKYGKNLIGSFYLPKKVLVCPEFIKTLPKREIACGFAEVIKYSLIKPHPLKKILENKYSDILKINFNIEESNQKFWFISKNKEEPRLANRFEENGADLEQPLAIARDIKKLYERLLPLKDNLKINQFLIDNSDLRHVVRRAFIIEKFPYSEIQDNTIGENLVPIDMLRLKLSFFGALKFDPRSDKWLRICMFQGAPLPNELKDYDEQWVYKTHS